MVWLELVSCLQDGTSSKLSIILHEELLTGLVSRWSKTLSSVSGENIVHDLVLISTGRFHEVEAYDEGESGDGYRLSGQCWLSYREGYPLFMWV